VSAAPAAAEKGRALLLDFGGVCILSPVELHRHTEQKLGLPERILTWMGPVDPSTDPLWRALLAEELTERAYWQRRADEVGRLAGRHPFSVEDYFRACFDAPEEIFIRPAALAVMARARAAGRKIGVLTNDLEAFHGKAWVDRLRFFRGVDALVDASKTGILKPDPRAYQQALAALGVGPGEVLFVDDQPRNVAGARALGIETIAFDIAHPDDSWRAVEQTLLGGHDAR
jgi:putative hydrolase of the HAD superfamily